MENFGFGGSLHTVKGHHGVPISVARAKGKIGPPVLLLHGGGQTLHAWRTTAENLVACGFEVFAADLRGHGDSGWSNEGDYSMTAFREDVRAVICDINRPTVVVGASLGGVAAMLVAGEAPSNLLRALVLVDIGHRQEQAGADRIVDFMLSNQDGFASLDEAADAVVAYLPHRTRARNPAGLAKNLRFRNGRYHWHWDPSFVVSAIADRASNDGRLERAARRIATPTLLLRGEESEILSREAAAYFASLIPQLRLVHVSGAAHMVVGDDNGQFSRALIDFLSDIGVHACGSD